MTTGMRGILGAIALLGLAGCAQPTAPVPATRYQAQGLRAPSEILVKFKTRQDAEALAAFGTTYGLRPADVIEPLEVHVMTILTREDATAIATRVERSPLVVYAEPNYRLSLR